MEGRNCPNCGAPYDMNLTKCPYCGTSYFDLTAIDLMDNEPIYLKVRDGNLVLTELARPHCTGITAEVDSTYYGVDGLDGKPLYGLKPETNITLGIEFKAVSNSEGHLFYLQKNE